MRTRRACGPQKLVERWSAGSAALGAGRASEAARKGAGLLEEALAGAVLVVHVLDGALRELGLVREALAVPGISARSSLI